MRYNCTKHTYHHYLLKIRRNWNVTMYKHKKAIKVLHCGFTFIILLLLMGCNYYYYRFAYQISFLYTLISICAIMQLFSKKIWNCLLFYSICLSAIIIAIYFAPKYNIQQAETIILENMSRDSHLTFYGLMTSETQSNIRILIGYKHYIYQTNDNRKIIFNINNGHYSVSVW